MPIWQNVASGHEHRSEIAGVRRQRRFAARNDVAYVCPKGHRTILPFAEGAEIPDEWECRCGSVAHREGDADREGDEISKPTRTHWDMLLERRSEEELATLLEKRLQMHRDGWIPDYE